MSGPSDITHGQRLNEAQRERLCELASHAFVALRTLGWAGKSAQAAALADAFHNLPAFIFSDRFNWDWARMYLETYAAEYPDGRRFLDAFDAIPR